MRLKELDSFESLNEVLEGVRHVILDVDDTVYLERDYVRSGFGAVGRYIKEQYGVGGFGDYCWGLFESGVRGNSFDLACGHFGLLEEGLVGRLVECYRGHYPEIGLCEDVVRWLSAYGDSYRIGIVTDGPVVSQQLKVEALGLSAYAERVVYCRALGYPKPAVGGFSAMMDYFGGDGQSYVYVGDNVLKDFEGPSSLGWSCVRIKREGGIYSGL